VHTADSSENKGQISCNQVLNMNDMNVFCVSVGKCKTTFSVYVKRRNFRLSVSPLNAEALVR